MFPVPQTGTLAETPGAFLPGPQWQGGSAPGKGAGGGVGATGVERVPRKAPRGPGVSKHQEMSIPVAKNWGNLGVPFEQTHTFDVKV